MRRVDLVEAALLHAGANRGNALVVAAKAQMVEPLLFALDQKNLILIATVAAEGNDAVTLAGRQTEGRIEFLAGFELGHGEGITQERLHRHGRPPAVRPRRGSCSAAARSTRNLY